MSNINFDAMSFEHVDGMVNVLVYEDGRIKTLKKVANTTKGFEELLGGNIEEIAISGNLYLVKKKDDFDIRDIMNSVLEGNASNNQTNPNIDLPDWVILDNSNKEVTTVKGDFVFVRKTDDEYKDCFAADDIKSGKAQFVNLMMIISSTIKVVSLEDYISI